MSDKTLDLAVALARSLFPHETRGRRAVRLALSDGRQAIAVVAACAAGPGEQILVSQAGRHTLGQAAGAGPADKVLLLLVEPADGY